MTNYTDIPTISPYSDVLPAKESLTMSAVGVPVTLIGGDNGLPVSFPFAQWQAQTTRYKEYWSWFTGAAFASESFTGINGATYEKFPLRVNAVRNIARKKARLLFGEPPERAKDLVSTQIEPSDLFKDEGKIKETCDFAENLIQTIWRQSQGTALKYENATIAQFLGGSYFQLEYAPQRSELAVPIYIKKVLPDFVIPVFNDNDPFALLEAWISYRIPATVALREYNHKSSAPYVVYTEHWDKETYSIWIDGNPVTSRYSVGANIVSIKYDKVRNPFGFVPIFYIPRWREGSFWGSSLVPDILGLMKEYNARFADLGTIVQRTANRKWIGRNISSIKQREFSNGEYYDDIGMQNPAMSTPPELWSEQPAAISDFVTDNVALLWQQILRETGLTHIHYGEDSSGQRSGESLEIRSWSAIADVRVERTFASEGYTAIAKAALAMLAVSNFSIGGKKILLDDIKKMDFSQQWHPVVARQRDQLINEIATLKGIGSMSTIRSIMLQGNVDDEEEELALIEKEAQEKQEQQMKMMQEKSKLNPPDNGKGEQGKSDSGKDKLEKIKDDNRNKPSGE